MDQGLAALGTFLDQGLPALGHLLYPGLTALGPKMDLGLPALGTKMYPGQPSPGTRGHAKFGVIQTKHESVKIKSTVLPKNDDDLDEPCSTCGYIHLINVSTKLHLTVI